MILILNEKNRVNNILKENSLGFNWKEDLKLLSCYYSLELKEKLGKSTITYDDVMNNYGDKINELLRESKYYNWLDKTHIEAKKSKISLGCKLSTLREIDLLLINKAVVDYISSISVGKEKLKELYNKKLLTVKRSGGNIIDYRLQESMIRRILLTMYVWSKILNSSIIKPEISKQTFKAFSGDIVNTSEYKNAINFLKYYGIIRLDNDMKHESSSGEYCYALNFDVGFNYKDAIIPEENEEYIDYVNRILKSRDNTYEPEKIPYVDISNFYKSKSVRETNIKEAIKIYVYPQELKEIYRLKGLGEFILLEPDEEYLELKGPNEYSNDLCDSKNYTDNLHNPGLFIDIYNNGKMNCDKCGAVIPNIKQFKIVEDNGIKINICGPCKSKFFKEKKKKELEKKRKEEEKYEVITKDAAIHKEKVVKKNLTKLLFCDYCEREFKLTTRRTDYNEVLNKTVPCLCPTCKKKFEDLARGDKPWYIIAQEEIDELTRDKEKESNVVNINSSNIAIDEEVIKQLRERMKG